jgi:hypothetical protein
MKTNHAPTGGRRFVGIFIDASPQNTCINQLQCVGCEVRQYFVQTAGAKPKVNSDKNIT